MFQETKASLRQLYLEDDRRWPVSFSGNVGPKSLRPGPNAVRPYNDTVLSIPAEQRKKPISVLCGTATLGCAAQAGVPVPPQEIPAIAEMIEGNLDRMRKFSDQNGLNIDANRLEERWQVTGGKWPETQHRNGLVRRKQPQDPLATCHSPLGTGCLGRGYPPPNRVFRRCTQRMKIDPVNYFVKQRVGHWGEAILHLGARRAESSTRAQTMAARAARNGLNRHPDLPRVWVSNPIEFLSTEEVWAYLLQNPNPWGGDNRPFYKLYASDANRRLPSHISQAI